MKETVMKKLFSVVVSMLMLLMFSGVALCSDAAPAAQQKSAKVVKASKVKKSKSVKAPYVSVQGGVAFLADSEVSGAKSGTIEFDPGYALGVAVGNKFGKVRAELELGYQKNNVDKCEGKCKDISGDMKAYSLLVNGYYDFINKTKITPYITAGIGVAKVDADVNKIAHVDDTGLAYQVGVGVAYAINSKLTVDLKYRYIGVVDLNGIEIDSLNPEFESNNVFLGLRYNF
jgi:opacity protein-like surface antigen